MSISFIAAVVTAAVLVAGGAWLRNVKAERDELRAQTVRLEQTIAARDKEAAAVVQQRKVNDETEVRLAQRDQELAQVRAGLAADLSRSLRDAAARACPRVPAVAGPSRTVQDAAAGARVQPPAPRATETDGLDVFNGIVGRLAEHAERASAAADVAAAERNELARAWAEHYRNDQARRQSHPQERQ